LHNTKKSIRVNIFILLLVIAAISACGSEVPTATPAIINVQYSISTQPWLEQVNACAGGTIVSEELMAVRYQDLEKADFVLRVGQPESQIDNAFQIGSEEIVVIVNKNNPDTQLNEEQVVGLFTGRIENWGSIGKTDGQVQVWVFPEGEDIQQIFTHTILEGSPITSNARLANNPLEMIQAIEADVNAIGILTRHFVTNITPVAFTDLTSLPVLAITSSTPSGKVSEMLTCLQRHQ
jgi:hypothetical protein